MQAKEPRELASELMVRYLEQLREAGEDQVYLSSETRSVLARRSGGSGSGSGSGQEGPAGRVSGSATGSRRGDSPGQLSGSASGSRRGDPAGRASAHGPRSQAGASEVAAGLPTPEEVECELALGAESSQADMFGQPSRLLACSTLEELDRLASSCRKCELATTRTNVVFGVGNPDAKLMFVGEAPGRDEDAQGIPFVGRAGQLLDKILEAAEIRRDDVYIGNIIKCRPPGNRTPLTTEIEACMPYLGKQIGLIGPRILCTLGLPSTQTLLGIRGSMGSLRGKLYRCGDIVVIPTYHPAAALRDPKYKRPLWEDFLLVKKQFDLI